MTTLLEAAEKAPEFERCDSCGGYGKAAPAVELPVVALQDIVVKAMRKAWQLGQTYWQQADSDYTSQHKKSDVTQQKFEQLIADTQAAIAARAGEDK